MPGQGGEHDVPDTTRSRTVTWQDPMASALAGAQLSGLEAIRAVMAGIVPPPPIAALMGMDIVSADPGVVVFTAVPDESHYNPIGAVHGGLVCTLLDSALGCAVHTTLAHGLAYTSLEIKVSYVARVHTGSGTLTATGRVTKPGKRVAFAEGEVVDASGRVVATSTSTFLVFPLPTA